MKLPITRVAGTTPPQFAYHQTVMDLDGAAHSIRCTSCVPASMETALCDLLRIAEQLARENEELRAAARKKPTEQKVRA